MLKKLLALGGVAIGVLTTSGYFVVSEYLARLHIPRNLTTIDVANLPGYGFAAFADAPGVGVLALLGLLLATVFKTTLDASATSCRRIYVDRRAKPSFPSYLLQTILNGDDRMFRQVGLPAVQIGLTSILLITGAFSGTAHGAHDANLALAGHGIEFAASAQDREVTAIEFEHGVQVDVNFLQLEKQNKLYTAWETEKTLYVIGQHGLRDSSTVYALNRDKIEMQEVWVNPLSSPSINTIKPNTLASSITNMVLMLLGATLVVMFFVASFDDYLRRGKTASRLSTSNYTDFSTIDLPSHAIQQLLEALQSRQDVYLTIRDDEGTSTYIVRTNSIEVSCVRQHEDAGLFANDSPSPQGDTNEE